MTDIKLVLSRLTTLAIEFELYASDELAGIRLQRTLKGQVAYHIRSKVWLEAAKELREALALEETVQRELAHTSFTEAESFMGEFASRPVAAEEHAGKTPVYAVGTTEPIAWVYGKPAATNNEIVGNDPADAASSKEFAADLKAMRQVTK